jgi:hypothetical protein
MSNFNSPNRNSTILSTLEAAPRGWCKLDSSASTPRTISRYLKLHASLPKRPTTPPTFYQIPNENFGVQYGAGNGSGLLGYEDVTIGGIKVKNQTFGIVNKSTNPGDGRDCGLIGLANPNLTSAHLGQSTPNNTFIFNRIISIFRGPCTNISFLTRRNLPLQHRFRANTVLKKLI